MNDLPQNSGADISSLVLAPSNMNNVIAFSEFMANGTVMIPEHFRGKPADCMAIVLQSMQWGMSPFQVAQKTHIVSGTLGYEAQLVNAVISSSTAITGRFHYEYSNGWETLNGKVETKTVTRPGKGGTTYTVNQSAATWAKEDEFNLWVRVGAVLRDESEIQWGEKLFLVNVLTRNSPLWVTKPDQQAAYLAVKYWARMYAPSVIMGVYTSDELDTATSEPRDITPAPKTLDLTALESSSPDNINKEAIDSDLAEVLDAIKSASDKSALSSAAEKAKQLSEENRQKALPAYQEKLEELRRKAADQSVVSERPKQSKAFSKLSTALDMSESQESIDSIIGMTDWSGLQGGEAQQLQTTIARRRNQISAEQPAPTAEGIF